VHVCPFTERANADEAAWRREQAFDKLRLAYHEAAHAIGLRLAGFDVERIAASLSMAPVRSRRCAAFRHRPI
jgi:hypothetical protein